MLKRSQDLCSTGTYTKTMKDKTESLMDGQFGNRQNHFHAVFEQRKESLSENSKLCQLSKYMQHTLFSSINISHS